MPERLIFSTWLSALAVFLALLIAPCASAQYIETNLVANSSAITATTTDPSLVDGWGISFFGKSPFWVSDQNTGLATLYTGTGAKVALTVAIPCIFGGTPTTPCPKPASPLLCHFPVPCTSAPPPLFGPTGTVHNPFAGDFEIPGPSASVSSTFLFSTLDGLIVGWNPSSNGGLTRGVVAANQSPRGANYFGLAIAGPASDPHLYAANGAAGGTIDVFNKNFNLVSSFPADHHPGPFTPYGIQTVGDKLYVTYASGPPVMGGILDICDLSTSPTSPKCHRLFYSPPTSEKFILNAPWGIALAPSNFGPLSNTVLVGNVNDGRINAFKPDSGGFVGTLKINGKPFSVPGLWALVFGTGAGGSNGAANQLFFAAGPKVFSRGLFGLIQPAP